MLVLAPEHIEWQIKYGDKKDNTDVIEWLIAMRANIITPNKARDTAENKSLAALKLAEDAHTKAQENDKQRTAKVVKCAQRHIEMVKDPLRTRQNYIKN